MMKAVPAPAVEVRSQSYTISSPSRMVAADTPIFRTQPADVPLSPHPSPYFDPELYNLRMAGKWETLYVSTEPEIAARHLDTPGYVMHESTLGDVVSRSGPGTIVFEDPKLPNSMVLVREGGASSSSFLDWSFSPWEPYAAGAGSSFGSTLGSWGSDPFDWGFGGDSFGDWGGGFDWGGGGDWGGGDWGGGGDGGGGGE